MPNEPTTYYQNFNIVITHGFAHRLRTDGLVESAPMKVYMGDITIKKADWQMRSLEDMDLSGGDFSAITDTLKRYRDIFTFATRRLPGKPEVVESVPLPPASEPL